MSNDTRRLFLESKYADESKLQTAIFGVLKDLGFDFRYHTHDSRRSEEGFPDVTAINTRAGVLWVAELKGLKTKIGKGQEDWIEAWRSVKRIIVPGFVRPGDYDNVVDQLSSAVYGDRIVR